MIQDICDTGKDILELLPALCNKREEARLKLAHLLELIGHVVKDAADKFRQGELPVAPGQQLEMLGEELYFRLAFCVGEMKARTLAEKLKSGYVVEQRKHDLARIRFNNYDLTKLEDAADYFLASANKLHSAINTEV